MSELHYDITVTPPDRRPPLTYGYGGHAPGPSYPVPRQKIVDFWKSKPGVKDYIAEGIADALHLESGIRGTSLYDPLAVNPHSGAIALGQYLGSRKSQLLAQPNWADPEIQFENMWREVTGGDKIATAHWEEIKSAPSREAAKELWTKYYERSAPNWVPSEQAIASEQNKSNTDVRYMTPEEYLSLLPPIEDTSANRAKRENLRNSLASGDNIEAIPSLDVTPRGDNLVVADWDGRNRAQAAIDAGVDQIPVALRGVPQERQNDFKQIVGDKKFSLPYTFVPVPPAAAPKPLATAAQQAREMVPQAFAQAPTPPVVPPAQAPTVPPLAAAQAPAPAPAPAAPPSKPDFYPEIAAGVNNAIINPTSFGYRGVGVPDLATNATASGRIAAANAGSAGHIGLGGAIGSALSALNPIGSAQAAEPAPSPADDTGGFVPVRPGQTVAAQQPAPTDDTGGFVPVARPRPTGWVPEPPGLATLAPPLANFLFSNPIAVAAGAAAGMPGTQPSLENLHQQPLNLYPGAGPPKSLADWSRRKAELESQIKVLETPVGNAISKVLNSPAMLLSAGINEMAEQHMLGLTPERLEAAAPYLDLIATLLPGIGLRFPRIGRALAAPVHAALSRIVRSPEMRAVAAANRRQGGELAAGGMTAPKMAAELARARELGIPAAPHDFLAEGGPQNTLLQHSLEHSPEAAAQAREFHTERTQGVSAGPLVAPMGGTLARSERALVSAFGPGSAWEFEKNIGRNLAIAEKARRQEADALDEIQRGIAKRERELRFVDGKPGGQPTGITPLGLATDPQLMGFHDTEARLQQSVAFFNNTLRELGQNKAGLELGQKVLDREFKAEAIQDFLATASPASKQHLQIGVKDALETEYRNSLKGREPFRVENFRANKDKVVAAFDGDEAAATDLMDSIRLEAAVSTESKNLLQALTRDRGFMRRNLAGLLLAGEAGLHMGAALTGMGHVYSAGYWGIRGLRHGANILASGGGPAAFTKREEVAKLFSNPDAVLSATGFRPASGRAFGLPPRPELFAMPARPGPKLVQPPFGPPRQIWPASSERGINALSRASLPLSYGMFAPQPEAQAAP